MEPNHINYIPSILNAIHAIILGVVVASVAFLFTSSFKLKHRIIFSCALFIEFVGFFLFFRWWYT